MNDNISDLSYDSINENEEEINLEYNNLILKNERLTETNSELQKNLEQTRLQLKKALETSQTCFNFENQIRKLQEKIENLTNQNIDLQNQRKEINIKEKNDLNIFKEQINKINKEKEELKNQNFEILKENENLKLKLKKNIELINEKNNEINNYVLIIEKNMKKSKKFKSNIKSFKIEINNKNNEINIQKDQINDLRKNIIELNQENDSLKIQIKNLNTLNKGNEYNFNLISEEYKQKMFSLNNLEETINNQKTEIKELYNQRDLLIKKIYNYNDLNLRSEFIFTELEKENNLLKQNLHHFKYLNQSNKSNNELTIINNLNLEFNNKILDECKKIFSFDQYEPYQRLQMVFNLLSKEIFKIQEEKKIFEVDNQKLTKININYEQKLINYKNLIDQFVKEILNISNNNSESVFEIDLPILNQIVNECNKIEPNLIQNNKINILFSSENINERKKILKELLNNNDEFYSLFLLIFSINILLRNYLNNNPLKLNFQEDLNKLFLISNSSNLRESISFIENIKNKLN